MNRYGTSTFTVIDRDGNVLGRGFTRDEAMHKILTYEGREYAIRSMSGQTDGPDAWWLWVRDRPSSVSFIARLFGRPKWQQTKYFTFMALSRQEATYKISELIVSISGPSKYLPHAVTDSAYDICILESQLGSNDSAEEIVETETHVPDTKANSPLDWDAMEQEEQRKIKKYRKLNAKSIQHRTEKRSK